MPENEYKIVRVQRWTYLDDLRNPVDGYRIAFVLPSGVTDWVHIPEREYSAERVRALIMILTLINTDVLAI